MKKLNKKVWLILGIGMTSVGVVAASTSLYFLTPSIIRVSQKGVYVLRQNTNLSNYGYKYDLSTTYGNASTNTLTVLLSNDLIHLKTEGKLKINPETNAVESPSYQSYEFGLADAIVIKLQNKKTQEWTEIVFDSDEAENEVVDLNNNQTVVEKNSKNKRSINNQQIFQKLLLVGALTGDKITNPESIDDSKIDASGDWIIKKLGFTIKPNVKWVDSDGNQTKYDVVAEDFWYSFMRTKLFDRDYRRSNGGSKELDEHFIKKTNATQRFQEKDRFPNEYLYEFFDLDSKKLYKKETAIEKTSDGRDMFVFNSLENVERTSGFSAILKKMVPNNTSLSAAPSQYIETLATNDKLNKINGDLEITAEARNFGIYTYGQTRSDVLYASPYVPKVASEGREIFEYNKYYANQNWVNAVEVGEEDKRTGKKLKAINKVIFEYSGGIETSTYNSQLLNSYLQGTVSEIKYSDLTTASRSQIYGNSSDLDKIKETVQKNGLQYSKNLNTSSLVQRTLIQSNPSHKVKSKNDYGFNENYSKLVFGLTLDELINGDKNTTESFFVNKGLDFRLLIQASINWDAYIDQSYANQRVLWLNNAAPDAKFTSASDSKAPIDYYEKVNTLQFIDYSDNNFTSPKLTSITPQEMKKHSDDNISNNVEQMKSPKFSLIQKNIKLILDQYYSDQKLDSSKDKIEWEVVYPWADKDTVKTTVMKNVVETIKLLDNRLEPKLIIPDNRDTMIAKISKNTGVSDFNGWGYDYEGIGSYIAAFSNGHGVTILNSFAIFSQENPTNERIKFLQENYPEFTKLAKFVKAKTDEEMKALDIDKKYWVENWDKVSNSANQDSTAFFKKETNNKYDPAVSLAKLLRTYEEEKLSNEEWATLIMELNSIKGVSLDPDNSILNPNTASLSLYLREYVIPLTKYGISYFQDYRYEEEKK